jgi:hypothetical protein
MMSHWPAAARHPEDVAPLQPYVFNNPFNNPAADQGGSADREMAQATVEFVMRMLRPRHLTTASSTEQTPPWFAGRS